MDVLSRGSAVGPRCSAVSVWTRDIQSFRRKESDSRYGRGPHGLPFSPTCATGGDPPHRLRTHRRAVRRVPRPLWPAAAIRRVLQAGARQRYQVDATCDLLTAARTEHRQFIAALIQTEFSQPDHDGARAERYHRYPASTVHTRGRAPSPGCSQLSAHLHRGPAVDWPKIWPNMPIERTNHEIERRTTVVVSSARRVSHQPRRRASLRSVAASPHPTVVTWRRALMLARSAT